MAIVREQHVDAQANSATLPSTPSVGHVIVVWAHRDGSTTAPTLPTGYTTIVSGGSNTNSMRCGFKRSDGTETTTSTWTNATSVECAVYSGCDPSMPIGASTQNGGTGATLTFGSITLQYTDGTSWVAACGAHRTATNLNQNAPSLTLFDSATDIGGSDSNGAVSSYAGGTLGVNASSGWRTAVVELVAKAANVTIDQLVWHVQSQTNGNFETGNNFLIPTANLTRQGNCLVLAISYAFNASRTVTVTDDSDGFTASWAAAEVTRTNNAGDLTAKVFVHPDIPAGIKMVKVTFDAALEGFQYDMTELWGIASSSPVDVSTSGQPDSPSMAVGSMTTTQANDVVMCWGWPGGWGTPYAGTAPTGFRAMQGHRLLAADFWIGFCSQIGIKATAGSVNSTIYMESPTVESFNMAAIALKTDLTKGSQATGIRIVGVQKMRMNNGTLVRTTFPSWGNLCVLASSETPSQCSVDAVQDSGNGYAAWTRLNTAGYPQLAYFPNSAPDQTRVLQVSNSSNFLHSVLYDIADANIAPYDTTAVTSGGTVNGPANMPNAPDITPGTQGGLVIGILNLFTGPPDDCSLPTGVIYDCAYHDGMTDLSTMDTGDGYSHVRNTDLSQLSFQWHETGVTTTGWSARAVAFKAPQTVPGLFSAAHTHMRRSSLFRR